MERKEPQENGAHVPPPSFRPRHWARGQQAGLKAPPCRYPTLYLSEPRVLYFLDEVKNFIGKGRSGRELQGKGTQENCSWASDSSSVKPGTGGGWGTVRSSERTCSRTCHRGGVPGTVDPCSLCRLCHTQWCEGSPRPQGVNGHGSILICKNRWGQISPSGCNLLAPGLEGRAEVKVQRSLTSINATNCSTQLCSFHLWNLESVIRPLCYPPPFPPTRLPGIPGSLEGQDLLLQLQLGASAASPFALELQVLYSLSRICGADIEK